jgi:hypothetical protein
MMAFSSMRSLVMKPVFVILAVLLLPWAVVAQTAAPAAKPGVNKSAGSKTASKKTAYPKRSKSKTRASLQGNALARPQRVQPAAVVFPPMPMGADELAIAERVHVGRLPCELGASVRLEADATQPGYFHVLGKGFHYRMHPVSTTTGAIRLEDKKAGAVWLQLANKSMLMDQNKGRRLADECAHPEQMAFAEDMKTNPPPVLFDTTGMGRPND